MARVISDTTPTARLEHRCDLCGRTIRAGETYRRVCVAQITPQLTKWCVHCDALVTQGDFDDHDEGVDQGAIHDADPRDWTEARWLVQWRLQWARKDGALYPLPARSPEGGA